MKRGIVPGEPEQRPSWLVPFILLAITAMLAAAILVWFLLPSFEDLAGGAIRPTTDSRLVEVRLGPRVFIVPANYIRRPDARGGGPVASIELEALLPDMHGYSDADAEAIADVTRQSQLVSLTLAAGAPELSEKERFERIYARNADPAKQPYPFAGFTVTPMAPDSGYATGEQQVFTREQDGVFVAILCSSDDKEHEIGGLCLREMAWGPDLTVTYAFRGGHIAEWNEVDAAVTALLQRLEAKPQ